MATWTEMVERFTHVTDTLGKPIDAGIFETVVALNMLGVCTTQSCEGHLEWGIAAPWVDLDPPGEMNTLRDRIRTAQQDEATEISNCLKQKQYLLFQDISTLLDQFYQSRERVPPYNQILLPHPWATGTIRLQSIEVELQTIVSDQVKAQQLQAFQTEMRLFTSFMKSLLHL